MTDEQHPQFTSSPEQWAKLKPRARQMRHEPTRAEDALWQRIRNRRIGGAKFRRQHAVEGFIVDFVCIERRLIVEVDGDIHTLPDQQAYDQQRQALLESRGFRVLRFANADVLQSIEAVAEVIGETLAQ
ncbi:MAG: endonuclease domain-containing protein [Anaerolineae bacterium]|nr:endonuclease domain-containing protein [Anaerolineae bacterium]NUQ05372.1 endonuclease domain-containing protein [Anaerolineae bacterium]